MNADKSLILSVGVSIGMLACIFGTYSVIITDAGLLDKIITMVKLFPAFYAAIAIIYMPIIGIVGGVLYKMYQNNPWTEKTAISMGLICAIICATFLSIISVFIGESFLKIIICFLAFVFIIPFNIKLFLELNTEIEALLQFSFLNSTIKYKKEANPRLSKI